METLTQDETASLSPKTSLLGAVLRAGLAIAVHLFVTIVIAMFLITIVPEYERFFVAHDTLLPVPTQILLKLSWWSHRYSAFLFLTFVAVDVPVAFGVQFLPKRMRWLKVVWFDSYLLAAIVFLLISSLALGLTISEMIRPTAVP